MMEIHGMRRWLCTACNARFVFEEMCVSGKLPDDTTACDLCGVVGAFKPIAHDEADDLFMNLVKALADGINGMTDAEVEEELADMEPMVPSVEEIIKQALARKPVVEVTIPISPIFERIVATEVLALIANQETFLRNRKRLVKLACGHRIVTSASERAACPRCREMLRRSIETGEEDYESFRAGLVPDRMIWADDPYRHFNEPSDLAGNLING